MDRSTTPSSRASSANSSAVPSQASSWSSIDSCTSPRHSQPFPPSIVKGGPRGYSVEEVVPDRDHLSIKWPLFDPSRRHKPVEDAYQETAPRTTRPNSEEETQQRVSTFQATFQNGEGANGLPARPISVVYRPSIPGFTAPPSHVTKASRFAEGAAYWIPEYGPRAALIAKATGEHPNVSVIDGRLEGAVDIEGTTQIWFSVQDP